MKKEQYIRTNDESSPKSVDTKDHSSSGGRGGIRPAGGSGRGHGNMKFVPV